MVDEAPVLSNTDGTYTDASPFALELLGVARAELLAMGPGSFAVGPRDPQADRAFFAAKSRADRAVV